MLTEGAIGTRDIDHIHKLLRAFYLKAHSYLLIGLRVVWTHTLNKWTEGAMFKIYTCHIHALLRAFYLQVHMYY